MYDLHNYNNRETDMIYNYVGLGDQTTQMNVCIKYVTKHHLGGAELIIEETSDRLLLKNLQSRLLATDSLLVSSLFDLGESALEVLDVVIGLMQNGVKIISVAEGIVDGGMSVFLSAVVSAIQRGGPHPTLESNRGRGQRMLLHG
jgi:DNA invertase Pin-like site-specific DNA recombinase